MDRPDPSDERYLESRSVVYRVLVQTEYAIGLVLLVGLLLLIVLQVVSRYVFAAPFTWTEELSRFVFIWMVFVAAAFVTARRRNIVVQLYSGGASGLAVAVIEAFANLVVIVSSTVMTIGGVVLARAAADLISPGTGIPLSVVYSAAVVGFALTVIHSLCNLWLAVRHPRQFAGRIDAEKGGI